MKIGLDVSSLVYQRGVSRYTSDLAKALLKENGVELFLYGSSLRQQKLLKQELRKTLRNVMPDRYQVVLQHYPPALLAQLWRFGLNPIKKHFQDLEVFHSWDWLQPPDKNLPLVSTIHDLAIIRYPKVAHPSVLKMHQDSWRILRQRQAQIIAVSEATKSDILRYLEIPSKCVSVVHEALPTQISEISQELANKPELVLTIKQKLRLNKPYLFFVGTREPRKNLATLIRAWLPLAKDYQLVIAGEQSWDDSEKITQNPNLRFLGRVNDYELAVLYHNCELFVYPSLYEGFGLPVLEAMTCLTPVICANNSSLLEVALNKAVMVEEAKAEDFAQAVESILAWSPTQRKKFTTQALKHAQKFTWAKTARITAKIYQNIAQK